MPERVTVSATELARVVEEVIERSIDRIEARVRERLLTDQILTRDVTRLVDECVRVLVDSSIRVEVSGAIQATLVHGRVAGGPPAQAAMP